MSRKKTKLMFTSEEDNKLVEAIAPHPAIYDLKNDLYKDQRSKDDMWLVIASEVGRPVADCKRRWKNIKDTHDRKTRECNKTGSEEPPFSKRRKWELHERLSFLCSSGGSQRSFCNIEKPVRNYDEIEIETTSDNIEVDDSAGSTPQAETPPAIMLAQALYQNELSSNVTPVPEKQKEINYREKVCVAIEKQSKERDASIKKTFQNYEESDDISLFFKSMAKTVLKFPPHLQQRAKIETLTLISKIECDMWSSRS